MVTVGRILALIALLVLLAPDARAFAQSTDMNTPEIAEFAPSEASGQSSMTPRCVGHCPGSTCLPALAGTSFVLGVPAVDSAAIGDAHRRRGDPADLDIVTPPPKAAV